jgi:hypothetical protein
VFRKFQSLLSVLRPCYQSRSPVSARHVYTSWDEVIGRGVINPYRARLELRSNRTTVALSAACLEEAGYLSPVASNRIGLRVERERATL